MKPVNSSTSGEHFSELTLVHTVGNMVFPEELDILKDFKISKRMASTFTDGTFGRGRKFLGIGLDSMDSRCIAISYVLVDGTDVGRNIKARTIGEGNGMDRCWALSREGRGLGRKVTAGRKQSALGNRNTTVSKRER